MCVYHITQSQKLTLPFPTTTNWKLVYRVPRYNPLTSSQGWTGILGLTGPESSYVVSSWYLLPLTYWVVGLDLSTFSVQSSASILQKKLKTERNNSALLTTMNCRDDPLIFPLPPLHGGRNARTERRNGLAMLTNSVVVFKSELVVWAFGAVVRLLLGWPASHFGVPGLRKC